MEITITDVTGLRLTDVEEYDLDEDEIADGENPFGRVITIETDEGTLRIALEAMTREALKTGDDT